MSLTSRRSTGGLLWLLLYAGLVTAPLLVLASGLGIAAGSGWWFDFAMGLGFGSLGVLGGQFLLTARFRRATAPFGVDVVYLFHRWLAVGGLGLVVAHYAILRVRYPDTLEPWMPPRAPLHMTAGRASLLLLVLLVASSLWRRRFGMEYDRWRIGHAVMAAAAMALALIHVRGVGYYTGIFWNRVVIDLFIGSLVAIVAYVRLVKPLFTEARPYRVLSVRPERGDVWTLTLAPEGHAGMSFMPGQFGWLSLDRAPWKAGEHPFSFSSAPGEVGKDDEGKVEMTIKELGDFTGAVSATEPGTLAYIDGPHGVFCHDLHPKAPGFLFVAGGIGIAPVMSMLRSMAERGDRRPVRLVYGNREWEGVVFRDELLALEDRMDLEVTHVLSDPPEGWQSEDRQPGGEDRAPGGEDRLRAVGMPRPELIRQALATLPEGVHAFLCGPPAMSRMAEETLRGAGVPGRRVHFELFEMA